MLQMLAKMIRAIKLFAAVAFPKLVNFLQVAYTLLPVLVTDVPRRRGPRAAATPGELFPTVATGISLARSVCAVMERAIVPAQCGTAPAVTTYMEAVLMAFCLILVLEAIATEAALILLLGLMRAVVKRLASIVTTALPSLRLDSVRGKQEVGGNILNPSWHARLT
jgi:hypothetical protein